MSHPSDDFKFGISTVVTEKEVDVDDRGAAIRVIVRFVKANPDTMWRLAEATLVLALDKDKHLPETISIEGGETSGQFMRFRLDTDEMEHDAGRGASRELDDFAAGSDDAERCDAEEQVADLADT